MSVPVRALALAGALLLGSPALAAPVFTLVIQDHQFQPAELEVPAGERIKLVIDNRDASAEEFESYSLNREKVIGANSKGVVFVGPLQPGRYDFFGEFHQDTAQGTLIVK